MRYEKMRGKSVSECVTRIRKEFGESAIIIEHREVQEGGVLGSGLFSRKTYEVDFMIPERESHEIPKRKTLPQEAFQERKLDAVFEEKQNGTVRPNKRERQEKLERENRLTDLQSTLRKLKEERAQELIALHSEKKAPVEKLDSRNRAEEVVPVFPSRSEKKPESFSREFHRGTDPGGEIDEQEEDEKKHALSALFTDVSFTQEEMRALMQMEDRPIIDDVSRQSPKKQKESDSRKISVSPDRSLRVMQQLRERLVHSRISPEFAGHFLEELEENLSPAEKREFRQVEKKSIDRLAEMIRTVPDIAPPRGECRAVMLVGPTGSGKTTTLAKLAARYQIYQKRDVSIYSLDHYRLAATEQLKFYASVIDVPFHAPLTPEAFQEDLRRDGAELMLIDTSGIGYRDTRKMEELKQFVDACEVRLEIHLTLPAGLDPAVLEKNLLAYDRIGFDKILVTKLDETEFIGSLIEHADKFNRPFSFITNGQEVPGDIMEAGALDLAKLVVGGFDS